MYQSFLVSFRNRSSPPHKFKLFLPKATSLFVLVKVQICDVGEVVLHDTEESHRLTNTYPPQSVLGSLAVM